MIKNNLETTLQETSRSRIIIPAVMQFLADCDTDDWNYLRHFCLVAFIKYIGRIRSSRTRKPSQPGGWRSWDDEIGTHVSEALTQPSPPRAQMRL